MTSSPPTSKNPTYSSSRPATEPLNALQKAYPDGDRVFTKAKSGTKGGPKGWNDRENLLTLDEAKAWVRQGGNVGAALGCQTSDGWRPAELDVEEQGVLPDAVEGWVDTYGYASFESLHDGLNRLLKVTPKAYDLLEASPTEVYLEEDEEGDHDLELLAPNEIHHGIIPPSTVEHRHCSDGKSCEGTGTGSYRLVNVNPDTPVVDVPALIDLLEMLGLNPSEGPDGSTLTSSYDPDNVPEPTETDVEKGRKYLGNFYVSVSEKVSDDLHDLLNGGAGNTDGLRHDDGTIDRDKADLSAVFKVYGVMRNTGADRERARELAYAVYSHFCKEMPYMKDETGRPRKWNRDSWGDIYRANRLDVAASYYEEHSEDWIRWKRQTYSTAEGSDGLWATHGDYSAINEDAVQIALRALAEAETKDVLQLLVEDFADQLDFILPESVSYPLPPSHEVPTPPEDATGGMDADSERQYPTKREVVSLAHEINPSRSKDTYETVLRKTLRDELGVAAMAKCPSRSNGNRWVYYPSNMPDPVEAEYVKENGREREPVDSTATTPVSPTTGQTAMTDGGVPREVDTDSTDGSDATWQGWEWIGDGPEDDGDDPASTPTADTLIASTADETDGPRKDNDPMSTSSKGRGGGERHSYGDKRRQDNDRRSDQACPDRRGGGHSRQTPTAKAVEPPTETQTPRGHKDSASSSSDTSTTGSTEHSEDIGDTTSDNPPDERDCTG